MPRPRKVHVQQSFLTQDGTKVTSRRGGRRPGAGRKPTNGRRGSPHTKRASFRASQPIHVSMKVVAAVGQLRKMDIYAAIRKATLAIAWREDLRIVHASLQDSHLHLLVEADNKKALIRGIQGFEISAARWINLALWERAGRKGPRRTGKVFVDRYYSEVIETPRQARNALAYVLNNWRRHREDRGEYATKLLDKFSTGILFDGWKERAGVGRWPIPAGYQQLIVWEPRTWLLREGWRRHGLISVHERPAHALKPSVARKLARAAR